MKSQQLKILFLSDRILWLLALELYKNQRAVDSFKTVKFSKKSVF